jgi:hypothetical protein
MLEEERPRIGKAVRIGPLDPAGASGIQYFEEEAEQVRQAAGFE